MLDGVVDSRPRPHGFVPTLRAPDPNHKPSHTPTLMRPALLSREQSSAFITRANKLDVPVSTHYDSILHVCHSSTRDERSERSVTVKTLHARPSTGGP